MTGIEFLKEKKELIIPSKFDEMINNGFELHHESGGSGCNLLLVIQVTSLTAPLPKEAFFLATGAEWMRIYTKGACDRLKGKPFYGHIKI